VLDAISAELVTFSGFLFYEQDNQTGC